MTDLTKTVWQMRFGTAAPNKFSRVYQSYSSIAKAVNRSIRDVTASAADADTDMGGTIFIWFLFVMCSEYRLAKGPSIPRAIDLASTAIALLTVCVP